MRIFIAVDLPEEIKEKIAEIQAELKKSSADVGWMVPSKFHFTLKFIGQMEEKKIEAMTVALKESLKEEEKFSLVFGETGVFPNYERMRVIWIGAGAGEEKLRHLAEKVENAAISAGAQKESRPFSAHLTLGRLRSPKNSGELKKKIQEIKKMDSLSFLVDRVKIFESILKPAGAEYVVLREIILGSRVKGQGSSSKGQGGNGQRF
jgi:2'-5' RNA ligase